MTKPPISFEDKPFTVTLKDIIKLCVAVLAIAGFYFKSISTAEEVENIKERVEVLTNERTEVAVLRTKLMGIDVRTQDTKHKVDKIYEILIERD